MKITNNTIKKKISKTTKENYLIPTTTLKSSSNDLFIYFWKLNLLPGAKWTCNNCIIRKWVHAQHEKLKILQLETYSDEPIAQCQVVRLTNRLEKLSKEASLKEMDGFIINSNISWISIITKIMRY